MAIMTEDNAASTAVSMPGQGDLRLLPVLERRRLVNAAEELLAAIRDLHAAGLTLVSSVLGTAVLTAWDHYPEDDVRDSGTGSQYFYHAHAAGDRPDSENGHFHLFIRGEKLGLAEGLGHLFALSIDPTGMPSQIFTTNQWVTGGNWLDAADVLRGWDAFAVGEDDTVHPAANRLLTALVQVLRPVGAALLTRRDISLNAWQARFPGTDCRHDETLEVLSAAPFDLAEWLDLVFETDLTAGLDDHS
jgi:hypothetical protein